MTTYPRANPQTWQDLDRLNIVDQVYQANQRAKYCAARMEASEKLDAARFNLQQATSRNVTIEELEQLGKELLDAVDNYQGFEDDQERLGWRDEAYGAWGKG